MEARYHEKGENGSLADGFLKLWMAMEFNRNSGNRWFTGSRGARKEIGKELAAVKFHEIRQKSGLHEQLLYRECCHLVDLYMNLCSHDKSYNTIICGIITISKDSAKGKTAERHLRDGGPSPRRVEHAGGAGTYHKGGQRNL